MATPNPSKPPVGDRPLRLVLETWFRRVWKEGNVAAIDEMFVLDGKAHGLGAHTLLGPSDFKGFHAALTKKLKGIEITIDRSVEDGDWLAALCSLRAKSARSGEPVTMTGTVFARIGGGKIHEAYNHWDFMGLFGSLGSIPSDAFAKSLSGS